MKEGLGPSVTIKKAEWGSVYKIGGTPKDGEPLLPVPVAQDIIKRFNHDQELFIGKKK